MHIQCVPRALFPSPVPHGQKKKTKKKHSTSYGLTVKKKKKTIASKATNTCPHLYFYSKIKAPSQAYLATVHKVKPGFYLVCISGENDECSTLGHTSVLGQVSETLECCVVRWCKGLGSH